MTGQLPASLSKLSRTVYLCPLPLLAQSLSGHANDPRAARHRTVERRMLARCGNAQRSSREQSQWHDRQLDRLHGEAFVSVSAPLPHRAWVDGTAGYSSTICNALGPPPPPLLSPFRCARRRDSACLAWSQIRYYRGTAVPCGLGSLNGTGTHHAVPTQHRGALAGDWIRITWTARCRRSSASSRTSRLCAPRCAAAAQPIGGTGRRRAHALRWCAADVTRTS